MAIVLILVVVVVVGGGVYVMTQGESKSEVSVTSPTVSSTVSVQPTKTASATVSRTPVPSTPKPVAVAVKFATVGEAVNSGKSVVCVTGWLGGKGPDEGRYSYFISGNTTIKVTSEVRSSPTGPIKAGSIFTYEPGTSSYSSILKYNLTSATCSVR